MLKTFYVTRDMKHPLYRGRMLTAGEQLELDGPAARLYRQLGAISDQKPRKAAKAAAPAEPVVKAEAPKPVAKPKAVPRKRATRKKAAAKKNA